MSEESILLYERYCSLSNQNNTQPIWFDDGFINNKEPDKTSLVRNSGDLKYFSSARVQISKSTIIGSGDLTLIIGFGAIVENLNINIISGDLTLFIGPHSEIKNLVIQSFDSQNYIFFGAANTLNTGNLLIQGERAGICFGHDCMFSTNFHARTSDSHSIFSYSTRQRINHDSSIKVGDHVWMGRQIIFNKGVEINDDVIIGQGSIVNGKLEGASCYAGTPAKKIKDNVTWDRARILSIDDIVDTYVYRPIQHAVNLFLLNDTPFHPYAKDTHLNIRSKYKINKCYPWISTIE